MLLYSADIVSWLYDYSTVREVSELWTNQRTITMEAFVSTVEEFRHIQRLQSRASEIGRKIESLHALGIHSCSWPLWKHPDTELGDSAYVDKMEKLITKEGIPDEHLEHKSQIKNGDKKSALKRNTMSKG
ncbi:hypothetical protein Ddye_015053 [Dipteronia dyeriana]|uniref:Uncharacterized protein n=1 Tax=Dipteronia dyeriana TaxID=168575 RepID=A0AAD9WXJ1_9ROSI|nr:hypothetical protein Ddye_015053 [Dipteronia dyeriana]